MNYKENNKYDPAFGLLVKLLHFGLLAQEFYSPLLNICLKKCYQTQIC